MPQGWRETSNYQNCNNNELTILPRQISIGSLIFSGLSWQHVVYCPSKCKQTEQPQQLYHHYPTLLYINTQQFRNIQINAHLISCQIKLQWNKLWLIKHWQEALQLSPSYPTRQNTNLYTNTIKLDN